MTANDTRARILAEATRQLTQLGYAAFTMAAVRDALELSSGSMFHAFASKPALAAAVYVEGMADYQQAAMSAIAGAEAPAHALHALIAVHLAWIEDHRALARYLFGSLPDEVMREAERPLSEHNARFFSALDALYQRLTQAGLMGALDRSVAQALCVGPAQEYGRQWTRGNASTPPRKLTRALQAAALAALATTVRGARAAKPRREHD
jgi:AcrR family transcriptional regulator